MAFLFLWPVAGRFSLSLSPAATLFDLRLVPLEEYMTAAAELMDKDPLLSGAVFFSTDNQTLVDDLESGRVHREMGGGKRNLTFYYTTYVHC